MELYLHIPFCVRKCAYCDFLSFPASDEVQRRYFQALTAELRAVPEEEKEEVTSIFLGGGTPSLPEPELIGSLFTELHTHFSIAPDAEISIEANPGTLSLEGLSAYRRAGINRLSLGLQSTQEGLLRRLGRIHTMEDFLRSFHLARQAGFENLNVDLMFALPGQSLADWKESLKTVGELHPSHISAYSLILESGTPLAEDERALAALPEEETEYTMYEETAGILRGYGYEQYEISNYALPGSRCRHNLGYWNRVPYLGLGLGAASCIGNTRFSNTPDLEEYLRDAGTPGALRREVTPLSPEEEMGEAMMLGLRLTEGVDLEVFARRYGCRVTERYDKPIRKYTASGHLELTRTHLRLTRAGIHVSNVILADFI